ncbi:DUF4440 domain-containing protein [Paraburkholderia mimosarum]|uniref:DUF6841 family protein n=2 Tax=Paraburkholderia mimosarum TaxID=312026 RepID=UPI0012B545D7|nr:DUF4440 domain-containing protein [Paraburkholderia mimosarum]
MLTSTDARTFMRTWIAIFLAVLALLSQGVRADQTTSGTEDAQDVKSVLFAYEEAWSRHDAKAIASFYLEPALRVSTTGPTVRPTQASQEAFFAPFLISLVKQGYANSTWERLDVHLLDANTAIASGVVVRYRQDRSVFQRQGVTYGLWRTDQGWKIFMSATHSPDAAIRFP